jgi:hypothetical protein
MPNTSALAKKLNLKEGMSVHVIGKPEGVDLEDIDVTEAATADAIIAFTPTIADLDAIASLVVEAAKADRIAWFAYPKAGQLGTDLNRDILADRAKRLGIQAVRQVSIDEVWSALRFRPAR